MAKGKKLHKCILCKRKDSSLDRGELLMVLGNVPVCTTCIQKAEMCRKHAMKMLSGNSFSENSISNSNCEEKQNSAKEALEIPTPKEIKKYLDSYIISQDKAKKKVAIGAYNHYKRLMRPDLNLKKSNILIAGPTGTGKTEIARRISDFLDVPIITCDVTRLSETGYVGADVEDILKDLLYAAGGDVKKAETGIVFLDEVDKLARMGSGEVSREGVQQALLKMVEGNTANVVLRKNSPFEKTIKINTENILFIASGAFEKMTEVENSSSIGFVKEETKKKEKKISAEDLIKQGMLPEFIGRFPILTQTKHLEKEELREILLHTEDSVVKEYEASVKADGFYLEISDDVICDIIDKAYNSSTGARSLRTHMDSYMENVLYDIPSQKEKGKVIVVTKKGYEIAEYYDYYKTSKERK